MSITYSTLYVKDIAGSPIHSPGVGTGGGRWDRGVLNFLLPVRVIILPFLGPTFLVPTSCCFFSENVTQYCKFSLFLPVSAILVIPLAWILYSFCHLCSKISGVSSSRSPPLPLAQISVSWTLFSSSNEVQFYRIIRQTLTNVYYLQLQVVN